MTDTLTQIGVGFAVVILVLRELPNIIKAATAKRNKESTGEHRSYVMREEFEDHKKAVQYRDNCGQIVKRIDGRFDDAEKVAIERQKRIDGQFEEVKVLIRSGGK
jgi:hypothetical protein